MCRGDFEKCASRRGRGAHFQKQMEKDGMWFKNRPKNHQLVDVMRKLWALVRPHAAERSFNRAFSLKKKGATDNGKAARIHRGPHFRGPWPLRAHTTRGIHPLHLWVWVQLMQGEDSWCCDRLGVMSLGLCLLLLFVQCGSQIYGDHRCWNVNQIML